MRIRHDRIQLFAEGDVARVLPKEFRISVAGLNKTLNGPYIFDEKAAKAVLEAFEEHGAKLPIDYDHLMLDPFAPLGGGIAAGWFEPEVRSGELWATSVYWTPAAAKKLLDLEYRYMTPAFYTDDEERMTRLINAALTNLPATHGLDPLVAASERRAARPAATQQGAASPAQKGTPMKLVLMALGLSAEATEAEALSVVSKNTEALKEIAALIGVRSANEAIGALPVIVEKSKRTDVAEAKATELEKEVRVAKADKEIDAKIAGGFMRTNERTFGVEMAKRDPEMFKGWLGQHETKLLNLSGGDEGDVKTNKTRADATSGGKADKASADELKICKHMGIMDIAAYREFKAKNGPVGMAPKDADEEPSSDEEASLWLPLLRTATPRRWACRLSATRTNSR